MDWLMFGNCETRLIRMFYTSFIYRAKLKSGQKVLFRPAGLPACLPAGWISWEKNQHSLAGAWAWAWAELGNMTTKRLQAILTEKAEGVPVLVGMIVENMQ